MKTEYGTCALCGKWSKLTYEHIPPKNAFNSQPARRITWERYLNNLQAGDNVRPLSELRFDNAQSGNGYYSLCNTCNNNTGAWYGDAYVQFANEVGAMIGHADVPKGTTMVAEVTIKPLNVVKQIISMFCSVNQLYPNNIMSVLRNFVLDKESHELGKFSIGIFAMPNWKGRMTPFFETDDILIPNARCTVSEIISFPFGLILKYGKGLGGPYEYTDITAFANFELDQEIYTSIDLPVHEIEGMRPGSIVQ